MKVVNIMLQLEAIDVADKEFFAEKVRSRMSNFQKHKPEEGGHMTCEEFCALCDEEMHRLELKYRADLKFKELDVKKTGYLTKDIMEPVVDYMLKYVRNKESALLAKNRAEIMAAFDVNVDGRFDITEFLNLVIELDFVW